MTSYRPFSVSGPQKLTVLASLSMWVKVVFPSTQSTVSVYQRSLSSAELLFGDRKCKVRSPPYFGDNAPVCQRLKAALCRRHWNSLRVWHLPSTAHCLNFLLLHKKLPQIQPETIYIYYLTALSVRSPRLIWLLYPKWSHKATKVQLHILPFTPEKCFRVPTTTYCNLSASHVAPGDFYRFQAFKITPEHEALSRTGCAYNLHYSFSIRTCGLCAHPLFHINKAVSDFHISVRSLLLPETLHAFSTSLIEIFNTYFPLHNDLQSHSLREWRFPMTRGFRNNVWQSSSNFKKCHLILIQIQLKLSHSGPAAPQSTVHY